MKHSNPLMTPKNVREFIREASYYGFHGKTIAALAGVCVGTVHRWKGRSLLDYRNGYGHVAQKAIKLLRVRLDEAKNA